MFGLTWLYSSSTYQRPSYSITVRDGAFRAELSLMTLPSCVNRAALLNSAGRPHSRDDAFPLQRGRRVFVQVVAATTCFQHIYYLKVVISSERPLFLKVSNMPLQGFRSSVKPYEVFSLVGPPCV